MTDRRLCEIKCLIDELHELNCPCSYSYEYIITIVQLQFVQEKYLTALFGASQFVVAINQSFFADVF